MLTIQNTSSNAFACVVYGVGGVTNTAHVPSGMRLEVPGFVDNSGSVYYGGLTLSGTLVAFDGPTGQQSQLFLEGGPTYYALQGAILALTLGAVVWGVKMIKRGIHLREGYE